MPSRILFLDRYKVKLLNEWLLVQSEDKGLVLFGICFNLTFTHIAHLEEIGRCFRLLGLERGVF